MEGNGNGVEPRNTRNTRKGTERITAETAERQRKAGKDFNHRWTPMDTDGEEANGKNFYRREQSKQSETREALLFLAPFPRLAPVNTALSESCVHLWFSPARIYKISRA